jgi:predicted O-methyltransferase YrrM
MIPFGQDETVKVDQAHADLLTGLIVSNKPKTVVELGIGGGQGSDAIIKGLEYNSQDYDYTIVDNWMDWNYVRPEGVTEKYSSFATIVDSDERAFVFGCNKKFDFIMSDADHHRTEQWFDYVYSELLNEGGILCYHDVNLFNDEFPNLVSIYTKCKDMGLSHKLFNLNSLPTERCERGLLVIFK